jgi:hypothetical protein
MSKRHTGGGAILSKKTCCDARRAAARLGKVVTALGAGSCCAKAWDSGFSAPGGIARQIPVVVATLEPSATKGPGQIAQPRHCLI